MDSDLDLVTVHNQPTYRLPLLPLPILCTCVAVACNTGCN